MRHCTLRIRYDGLTVSVVWQHCAPPLTLHWLTLVAVGTAVSVTVVVDQAAAATARDDATRRREKVNCISTGVCWLLLCFAGDFGAEESAKSGPPYVLRGRVRVLAWMRQARGRNPRKSPPALACMHLDP